MKHLAPLALALAVVAGRAAAQPAPDKSDAQALMQSGLKLFQAKDYLGALAVFKDAYTRFPSAKILLNIGTTLRQLDRDAEAANTYQRYLDSADADPKKRPDVEKVLAELDRGVGMIAIELEPATATLEIGGEILPVGAKRWRVKPGATTVRASAKGFEPTAKELTTTAGSTTTVTLGLSVTEVARPTPAPDPAPTGVPLDTHLQARVEPPAPTSRFGAVVRAHVDVVNPGAAGLVGVTVRAVSRLDVQAAALLGKTQGGYLGASYALLPSRLRPIVVVGMPVFVSDGARFAVRGAAGVELAITPRISMLAELGVERMLNAEAGRAETVFVPALGAVGRL